MSTDIADERHWPYEHVNPALALRPKEQIKRHRCAQY